MRPLGGAIVAKHIAPPVPNYTHFLRNKITRQTDATYATYIPHSDQRVGGWLKQIRRVLIHADSCPKSDDLGFPNATLIAKEISQ
jgi:hypothetical protein